MVTAPLTVSDAVATFLTDLTGSGTEQLDAKDDAGEQRETIIAYLLNDQERTSKEAQLASFLDQLRGVEKNRPDITVQHQLISEEDWGMTWKQHFKPLHISPHLVIKPSWESYQPAAGVHVLEMDPGMAFGTGHHASTRLALGLAEELFEKPTTAPRTVLDVGTGTGILAMACCLFGARQVLAIDNDPDAVAAGHDNVQRNRLTEKMEVSGRDLTTIDREFDLVLANIIHDTLIELAPALIRCTSPGGHLILAGILRGEQEENIRRFYTDLGLTLTGSSGHEEWAALAFKKAS